MIYLDNAATSFPKPPSVIRAVSDCLRLSCGNPGRGSHALSRAAAETVFSCRERAATLFDLSDPSRVVFTAGATASINTVLKGILRPGDHVLISDLEHNSVFRPLSRLAASGQISFDLFPTRFPPCQNADSAILSSLEGLIRPNTRLIFCTHASNIAPIRLPIRSIGAFCRKRGILFGVDAAQSGGHYPISMKQDRIDYLCLPAHKGLRGIPGAGLLLFGERPDLPLPETLTEGGSGYASFDPGMPSELPERFEAGTLPVPAIAGLSAGLEWVLQNGQEAIASAIEERVRRLGELLSGIPRLRIFLPEAEGLILLFSIDGIPSEAAAGELDRRGFCVRGGFHCAPLAHRALGTPEGGAVRVSPSELLTDAEAEAFAKGVRETVRLLRGD